MKSPVRSCVVVLAVLMMASLPVIAGDDAPKHRLILVHEVHVNPDRSADHEALITDFLEMTPQHKHSMPFATFALEDGSYFYATFLAGYDDLDAFDAAWMETMGKMGEEKMAEFMTKSEGVTQYHHDSLWWERLDLSYVPEGVDVDPTESTFRFWGWFFGKPGHEMQIEEYFKKYIELFKKHGITRGWYTYVGSFGTDGPVYVWSEIGDSEAAFAATSEAMAKKMGEEADELWNGMKQHARKVEFMRGTYRPELSYTPAAEEE